MDVAHAAAWTAVLAVGAALFVGTYAVGVLDEVVRQAVRGGGVRVGSALTLPWRRAALLLLQERVGTERPDAVLWALAPALYGGLAAAGLTIIPLSSTLVVADFPAAIVLWGALEALALVAVYLHGWAPNSVFPLVGGYRFVAQATSYELLSMFVLIAVALPAQSLALTDIVRAQDGVWNAVRHPPALPLWIVVTLGVSFWGPLNLPDGNDLAGGTAAEVSGSQRLVWALARAAMLIAFSAMGATALLGGWLGPWLPGPVWVAVKTLALLVVVVALGHLLPRVRVERFVFLAWTVLLPLAFVDLLVAGLEALR
jgi:NADH-quinone oxidoreductase subunit H